MSGGDNRGGARIGLWSGVGLVVASMVGAGVLTSNGYMAGSLPSGTIFAIWAGQAVVATLGAIAYARISQLIPRSGGEYRYLSELVHPFFGFLAGWTSLLIGFAAPVATNALAAGIFAKEIHSGVDPVLFGSVLVVAVTALQTLGLRSAKWAQNSLVAVKVLLFVGLIAAALLLGRNALPEPTQEIADKKFSFAAIAGSFWFAAYAFSGWNASIYAAEEFIRPRRDVARSMIIGVVLVTILYLAITFVFLANLPDLDMSRWDEKRVTIAHLIMRQLVGPGGAALTSMAIILVLASSTSAMTLIGPRVNAAMAADGYLPKLFVATSGRPPVRAILAQSVLALVMLRFYRVDDLMANIGIMLTFTSSLTVLGLVRAKMRGRQVGLFPPIAAFLYAGFSGWTLFYAFKLGRAGAWWIAGATGIALVGYWVTQVVRRRTGK